MNLTNHLDNMLNIIYKDMGDRSATSVYFEGPSATIFDQHSRHICMGKIRSQNKTVTVKYVIGTHHNMTWSYPEWAEFHKKNWQSWIEVTEPANQYQKLHLP